MLTRRLVAMLTAISLLLIPILSLSGLVKSSIAKDSVESGGRVAAELNQPKAIGFLSAPNEGEALDIALAYLDENQEALGLTNADLADLIVTDQYVSEHNGMTHIYLRQRVNGIEVVGGNININIASDGSVINLGNRFIRCSSAPPQSPPILGGKPGPSAPPQSPPILGGTPSAGEECLASGARGASLSAIEAVESAAEQLGLEISEPLVVQRRVAGAAQELLLNEGGISQDAIPAKLVYQPHKEGLRLAWDLVIHLKNGQHWWNLRVDALTGEILEQQDWIDHENWEFSNASGPLAISASPHPALPEQSPNSEHSVSPRLRISETQDTYRVFPLPYVSPEDVGATYELVTNPADVMASPFGWHDTDGVIGAEFTDTRGNNVSAQEDANANDSGGFRPDGGKSLLFDFAFEPTLEPTAGTNREAAIVNLFYWANLLHDVFYHYGFDEVSGNFQQNNYGNGGEEGDPLQADTQDGLGTNNATFATPPDGDAPRMQMFTWTFTSPNRDSALENGVIIHEYGHGVSDRLTGGPSNVSCLFNDEQMGEGWSDWFTLVLTAKASDTGSEARGIGQYVLGQPLTGNGIRPTPYSTDMTINPVTYGDLDDLVVPHGVGYAWASMLWEVYWKLVDKHGFDPDFAFSPPHVGGDSGGNNIAMQLVIDALKLQPCSPGFVEARDAILLADQINNGGANQCLIWEGFAKRGLGVSATQGSADDTSDGSAAFDIPSECQFLGVTPATQDICVANTASYSIMIGEAYTAPITMSASGHPAGTTAIFKPNPVNSVPGRSELTISQTKGTEVGEYTITITGTGSITSAHTTAQLRVFDTPPSAPTLNTPADGASDVSLNPTLEWKPTAYASSYIIEVDDDPNFSTIDYTVTISNSTSHLAQVGLATETTYYWRVRADNPCGQGRYSVPSSFTTGSMICSTPGLPLSDYNQVTDKIIVGDDGLISDLNVSVMASHTYVRDLIFTLQHVDTGTSVTLINRPTCRRDDIDATLDDEAAAPVDEQCAQTIPTISGSFMPSEPLSAFDFERLSGTWQMRVTDNGQGDSGTFEEWCLMPTITQAVGTLAGQVIDADFRFGVPGAVITATHANQHYVTTTDEMGHYTMTLGVNRYDLTVAASNYLSTTMTGVTITTDTITTQDIVLQGSSLTYQPPVIEEFMLIGDRVTNTVTLTNSGPFPINYSLAKRALPTSCTLLNGDFESGDLSGWSTINGGGAWFINDGTYTRLADDATTPPVAGRYSAFVDQSAQGTNILYQDIVLPANLPDKVTISWIDQWENHASTFTNDQEFRVELYGPADTSPAPFLGELFTTDPSSPVLSEPTMREVDITALVTPYAGQSVRLQFVEVDTLLFFNVQVDNVQCQKELTWVKAPITGTIAPHSNAAFDVIFDATSFYQIGDFLADLSFSGNFVNDVPPIPLTMHVSCPTCGLLNGSITDVETGDPLSAKIHVIGAGNFDETLTSDRYKLALQPGSYDLTVSANGYLSQTVTITATEGMTITTDFALIPAIAKLHFTPSVISDAMQIGQVISRTVMVTNSGVVDLDFKVRIGNYNTPRGDSITDEGGPDEFGYHYIDSNDSNGPRYNFIDISPSGTSVALRDESSDGPFPIGFPFDFYGTTQNEFYLSANGFISFDAGHRAFRNQCSLPNADTPNNIIALMWDDLDPADTNDLVYYQHFPTCPVGDGECLIVQYDNYHHFPGGRDVAGTFEAILFENGDILLQYADVGDEGGENSTTGIENGRGLIGLNYETCNTEGHLTDKLAICFAHPSGNVCGSQPWVKSTFNSGVVPPGESSTFDVIFDTHSLYQEGEYSANLSFFGNFVNDPGTMPLTISLTCPSCGYSDGLISDAHHGNSLTANLHVTGQGGFDVALKGERYHLALQPGAYDFTVSANGYLSQTTSITITQGTTVTTNFALVPAIAVLDVHPSLFSQAMQLGDLVTNTLTLSNSGTIDLNFNSNIRHISGTREGSRPHQMALTEQPERGFSIPASDGNFLRRSEPPSIGVAEGHQSLYQSKMPLKIGLESGVLAYGPEAITLSLMSFDTSTPGSLNSVASISPYQIWGADFLGSDFSTLYGLTDGENLVAVETATGNTTRISAVPLTNGQAWTGMAGDPTSQVMYATSTDCTVSILYTVDVSTGSVTEIGDISNSPCIIGIAANAAGELYGLDIANDNLIQIDHTTGAGTIIGSVGFDARFSQGMDFDELSNTLYLAAFNGVTRQAELRIADTTTGNTTMVGLLGDPGAIELNALAVATSGISVPDWAIALPDSGTIPPNSSTTLDMVFDARSFYQTGDYNALLSFTGNFTNHVPTIPLTMQLSCATCGVLNGSISDVDTGNTLSANIHVTGSNGFDVMLTDESYLVAVQPGNYHFSVGASGYLTQSTTITATQGTTVTTNFALIPAVAKLDFSPQAISQTMEIGQVSTNTVTVTNTGVTDLEFNVQIGQYSTPRRDRHDEGGPDRFGYSYIDSNEFGGPSYNFIDITSSGTTSILFGDDESQGPIPIGFDFDFYGTSHSEFYLSSNSLISFGNEIVSRTNQCPLPDTDSPNDFIALMWDDLDPGDQDDLVYYESFATCPIGGGACLIVQYDKYHHFPGGGTNIAGTFEAILFENGDILLQYADAGDEEGLSSTTGIENSDGTSGLTYANCNTAGHLTDELAICFAHPNGNGCAGNSTNGWAKAIPNSATVAPGETTTFDLLFDANSFYQIGQFNAKLSFSGNFVNQPGTMPLTMQLTCPTCGFLNGSITDADTGEALSAHLQVTNADDFNVTLTGDRYNLALPPGTYDVTVSANNYLSQTTTLVATEGISTTTNFALIPAVAKLNFTPPALSEAMQIGDIVTHTISVTNSGVIDLNFGAYIDYIGEGNRFGENHRQVMPLQEAMIRQAVERASVPNGVKKNTIRAADVTDKVIHFNTPLEVGDLLFQLDAQAATGSHVLLGVEYANGTYFVTAAGLNDSEEANMFYQIDANGTLLNSWTQPTTSEWGWRDMAFDGVYLYASDSNVIEQIDPTTGQPTGVTIASPEDPARALAYDPTSDTFWVANFSSSIYQIDRDGTVLNTFSNSFSIYGLAWDAWSDSGPYLWAWSQDGTTGHLATQIDPSTGNLTGLSFEGAQIGPDTGVAAGATIHSINNRLTFIGLHQVSSDTIAGYDLELLVNSIEWAKALPNRGTVSPHSSATFDVVFDATSLYQTGDYNAQLRFWGNFSNQVATMPLTMQLSCPTCGRLTGSVTDAYTGEPLLANIHLTNENTLDDITVINDNYALTVPADTYSLTVSAQNYFSQTISVVVTQEMTTTTNLSLLPITARLEYTPTSFNESVSLGQVITRTLTLTNSGTIPFEVELSNVQTGSRSSGLPTTKAWPDEGRVVTTDHHAITTCPPDEFGYTCLDSNESDGPTFNWIDISSTGTQIALEDNNHFFPINLPFDFNFYGTNYNQLAVSSKGTIYFEDEYMGFVNRSIPSKNTYTPQTFIALYWDNLDPSSGGAVYYEIQGSAPIRKLIVQFDNVSHANSNDAVTAQAILYESSNNILLQYLEPSSEAGDGATEGIQADPTMGLEYGYNQAILTPELAVCYVHPASIDANCAGLKQAEWLITEPISGTIEAGDELTINLIFDTTVFTQTGTYSADLHFNGTFDNQVNPAKVLMEVKEASPNKFLFYFPLMGKSYIAINN